MPSTSSSDDIPSAAPDSNTGNPQQTPGPLEPFQLTASQRLAVAADESIALSSPGRLDQLVDPMRRQRHSSSAPLPPASSAASLAAAAAIGLENAPSSDDEALATHAQIAALYEEMDAVMKDAIAHAAEGDNDLPVPHSQIAAEFENIERTLKDSAKHNSQDDAPLLHPSQIAAGLMEETSDEEKGAMKRAAAVSLSIEGNVDPPPTPTGTSPPSREQDEVVPPRTPPVTRATPPNGHQSSSNQRWGQWQQNRAGPPPLSAPPTLPEDDIPAAAIAALQRESSVPMLQATLVQDQEVYDGIPITEDAEKSFCEKYRNVVVIIASLVVMLIGALVAVGVTLGSTETTTDSERSIEPEGILSSTTNPSESLRPSQIPSLRPSLSASQVPSLRPSLSASQVPSFRPSLHPSSMPSPTLYCGEVNIVTDEWPEEISWRLSSTVTGIDGNSIPTKVVLKGSPEEKRHYHVDDVCLERGEYEFVIFDSYGDGIESPGYYNVTFDGVVVAQGGEFRSEEKVSFSLPIGSLSPSESASPSRAPPSLRPSTSFSPSTFWSSLDWNRQGQGISGDAINGWFGNVIAFSEDALTMAIGAPGPCDSSDGQSYLKVFHREGEKLGGKLSWEQRGNTLFGEAHGDRFGTSVSLSDDGMTLSVGAPANDFNGFEAGQVKVYRWDEGTQNYEQLGETLYGEASGDHFGFSLDLSSDGKILAVGAIGANCFSGNVHVYAWDDDNATYKQRGQIISGDAAAYDWFGYHVSLAGDGSKLAVGALYNGSNGEHSGQVKVFAWDEATSNYKQLGDSLIGDEAGDYFGGHLSFSRDGSTLAIGAYGSNGSGFESGQVQVFKWDEAILNHKQVGKSLYGASASDAFGWSVALSSNGKTLAIGATQSTLKPGYVQVFGWNEAASEYKQFGKTLVGEAAEDWFGYNLALSANGKNLAVGAVLNDQNGADSGLVQVFDNEF